MRRILSAVPIAAALTALSGVVLANEFLLDAAHSTIEFKVRHMAISKTRGTFSDFSGSFFYDPDDPASWRVEAVIHAGSLDTGNEDRDYHLRSDDFLFVEKYPIITFRSTGVELAGENEGKLMGDITMRGVTRLVVLDLEIYGMVVDPWNITRAGFAASGAINRKDFGLKYHKLLETGGLVVGDKVEILIEAEGILQK